MIGWLKRGILRTDTVDYIYQISFYKLEYMTSLSILKLRLIAMVFNQITRLFGYKEAL